MSALNLPVPSSMSLMIGEVSFHLWKFWPSMMRQLILAGRVGLLGGEEPGGSSRQQQTRS